MPGSTESTSNFAFLHARDPLLAQLAVSAERYCHDDPNASLLKLRQFGEAVAQHVAALHGIAATPDRPQADMLADIRRKQVLDGDVLAMLHMLRTQGNEGVHRFEVDARAALGALRIARQLAIWFHRAFRNPPASFKPGPFTAPAAQVRYVTVAARQVAEAPEVDAAAAAARLAALQADLDAARQAVAAAGQDAERARADAAVQAQERALWQQLAQDEERERQRLQAGFDAELARIRAEAAAAQAKPSAPAHQAQLQATMQAAQQATRDIDLDEAETRALIDHQLRAAGWEADSQRLRFARGAQPEVGRNMAIAEWPTASGPADYVLFCGLQAMAVVEAKRFGLEIASVVGQAERYSLGFEFQRDARPAVPPGWAGGDAKAREQFAGWPAQAATVIGTTHFRVPFVFSANGRDYHRQFLPFSGVWHRDVRRPANHADALPGWHTPEGLLRELAKDVDAAERELQAEPFGYLGLRPYQERAVQAVEGAIAAGRRTALVAMATGTGKTRTVIGLIYRLLKTKRFQRVLFLVDRSALGEQAQNAFKDARLEQNRRFTEIYELKELADITPDAATKVHVATVQGMVRRLFAGDAGDMPVDRYDCIIIDEAHRGYILDREMGEGELLFRDETDYISAYRRVLDQFDAVKIALTATPAQHTTQIFGLPVTTYSYHEAVIDGWLIDHLPPIRLLTQLAAHGIHFDTGATVTVLNSQGSTAQQVLPDELDYEIDHFNRLVITPDFNRVVCDEISKHLDPMGDEKTLVFCANDTHADLVVNLLTAALEREHGPVHDKTVLKITGRADKPDELIRLFKNEALPKVAVTVDLLTTGIDVPAITNLVFLRRVRSRILYEQMLGRATRLCPAIGKEHFRIFDAVDLYAALDAVNTMRPVVQNPNVPLPQLLAELQDERAGQLVVGQDARTGQAITHADELRDQLLVRVRNLLRRAQKLAGQRTELRDGLQQLQLLTGLAPAPLVEHLRGLDVAGLRAFMAQHGQALAALRTEATPTAGVDRVLAPHADQLLGVEHGWGPYQRPEDYLGAFHAFIRENVNRLAALEIVLTRPRDLTAEHLRSLRVEMARHQFTEPALRTAFAQARQEDVAATVIGYIRQLALGSPLLPFATRVDRAVARLLARGSYTPPQRRWLERIATTLKDQVVVDESTFAQGAYVTHGGFKAVDKVFGGHGKDVIGALEDEVWSDAA
ncbi:type I restriction-modification system endonuclease [Aquabacterium sp. OR-4]|uniref:type I restriction-modification system endonuclease n=1 Tax=Aquabacterium sp. OR-4 TaxID=2978127 RepID=UPI0028C7617A|nr:type I restriction-modification system endonuclease [Aquabacterium sp. OR-4]MDT7834794.1 type I restriction-modification system endonuclease [Aquabacterium sp. OR-4]